MSEGVEKGKEIMPAIKDPQTHKCSNTCCSAETTTLYDNTKHYVYAEQPWFNHTRTECSNDDCNWIVYRWDDRRQDPNWSYQFRPAETEYCEEGDAVRGWRRESLSIEAEVKRRGDDDLIFAEEDIVRAWVVEVGPATSLEIDTELNRYRAPSETFWASQRKIEEWLSTVTPADFGTPEAA
jgi:hypothetical protein